MTPGLRAQAMPNAVHVVLRGSRQGVGRVDAEMVSAYVDLAGLGIPGEGGLDYVGRVGTGFTEKELGKLRKTLKPLHTDESPFTTRLPNPDAKGVTFVRPELVGEVRYSERTTDGRLRQPSWRGLRPDKSPDDVAQEG